MKGSYQSVKSHEKALGESDTLRVHEKFSREFEGLLPVNSDFTLTFLRNSLENFAQRYDLSGCTQPSFYDSTGLKLSLSGRFRAKSCRLSVGLV